MASYIFHSLFYVLFCCIISVYSDTNKYDACTTPQKQSGKCVTISDCPPILDLLDKKPIPAENLARLKEVTCGFIGVHPKVCCALEDLNKTESPTNQILPSLPEGPVSVTQKTPAATTTPKPATLESNLLPTKEDCGFFIQDRIDIRDEAQLDAYPWMVLLEYQKPNGTEFHCGGVLINGRYVLTAAHCIAGPNIPKDWSLIRVRLGEHDTRSDPDCDVSLFATFDCCCAVSALNVTIEEKIVHEEYDASDRNQYNDIALIRLSENVKYTEFVRPVCLQPIKELTKESEPGKFAEIGGWGITEFRAEGHKKHSVRMQIKNNSECQSAFKNKITMHEKQLCAEIRHEKDACYGDSGGVLMNGVSSFLSPLNYYAIGIMSFGSPVCSAQDYPVVYTNVKEYFPWIISKLRP